MAGDIWYAGPSHQIGQATTARYGTYLSDRFWTTTGRDERYSIATANFMFSGDSDYANDSAVHARWEIEYNGSDPAYPEAHGSGYFDCILANEVEIPSCGGTFNLPSNQWRQISLPCHPVSRSKVTEVFASLSGTYGSDWVVHSYDSVKNTYVKLSASDSLEQGKGYWVIQRSGDTVALVMPQGSVPTLTSHPAACTFPSGCVEIPLETKSGEHQWNMIAYTPMIKTAFWVVCVLRPTHRLAVLKQVVTYRMLRLKISFITNCGIGLMMKLDTQGLALVML